MEREFLSVSLGGLEKAEGGSKDLFL